MRTWFVFLFSTSLLAAGCNTTKTTNTARTAKEQLLISNSVDQALDKVSFAEFQGRSVLLDEKYLDAVDKNYIVASVRHRILLSGAKLVAKPEEADIVVEVRSGAVGTDTSDMFLGIPGMAVPGPLPLTIPEVRFISRTNQTGTAKIGLVAYEAKSKQRLGTGGLAMAQSDDNNWYVMGMGPYQNGTIRHEVAVGVSQPGSQPAPLVPRQVAFAPPEPAAPQRLQLTSGQPGPAPAGQ